MGISRCQGSGASGLRQGSERRRDGRRACGSVRASLALRACYRPLAATISCFFNSLARLRSLRC